MGDGRTKAAKQAAKRARQAHLTAMASEFFMTVCPTPGDELLWPVLKPTFEGLVQVALAAVDQRRRERASATIKSSAEV